MVEETGLEAKPLETIEQPKPEEAKEEKLFDVNNPDELPDPLKETYNQWQKNYTQKRQQEKLELKQMQDKLTEAEKEKIILENTANQFNTLINDPSFIEWAMQKSGKGSQSQEYEPKIDFEQYEDGDGVKTLLNEMRNMVRSEVNNALTPVMQNFATTREQNEFNALVDMAKQSGQVDPNKIRKEIDFIRRTNPNLSLVDAYEKAAYRSQLSTRPPVVNNLNEEIKKEIPTTKGNPITMPPSSSNYQESRQAPGEELDKLMEEKKKGGSPSPKLQDIINNVLKERGMTIKDFRL